MSIKKPVNFEINSNMLIMGDSIGSIEVPDRWTFLLMYASINRFRPKDIPEVINLTRTMHLLGDFGDKDRLKLFYKLLLGNKKAFSPYHAIRYMLQSRLTGDGRNERQLKSFATD